LAASGSICVILTFTIANSAATKKAFRETMKRMRKMFKRYSTVKGGGENSVLENA
jgi:hypothetical protein